MQRKDTPSEKKMFPGFSEMTAIVLYALFFSFLATAKGTTGWDDYARLRQAKWLMGTYGLGPAINAPSNYSYAPLWELMMGVMNKYVFWWLQDELWVRHALTFSLLPLGLWCLFWMLRRIGISRWGSLLCLAGILGHIRLIGHATMNVKDFPAAMVFLVCTVGMWRLLSELEKNIFSVRTVSAIGILAALPFLVRSPLITLLPLAYVFLFFHVVKHKKELQKWQIGTIFLCPVLVSLLFIFAASPALWAMGKREMFDSTVLFTDYPWRGAVRFFGMQYPANALPRWFAFVWLPVGVHLGALAACTVGLLSTICRKRKNTLRTFFWGFGRIGCTVDFLDWFALVTCVSFASVILTHPTLYDEDRHILFLLLLVYTLGFLGLEWLSEHIKKCLTVILILWSVLSVYRWGSYAYIYRNPLIADSFRSYHFMGDYWSACSTKAAKEIFRLPSHSIPVSYKHNASQTALRNIFQRQREGFLTKMPEVAKKKWRKPKGNEPFWYILGIRSSEPLSNMGNLGRTITKTWSDTLPTGEPACSIYRVIP